MLRISFRVYRDYGINLVSSLWSQALAASQVLAGFPELPCKLCRDGECVPRFPYPFHDKLTTFAFAPLVTANLLTLLLIIS